MTKLDDAILYWYSMKVQKVKDGYDVIIRIPFTEKKYAEDALKELRELKERHRE